MSPGRQIQLIAGSIVLGLSVCAWALTTELFAGQPAFQVGQDLGMFVWQADSRLHVCANGNGTAQTFTGRIEAMRFDGLQLTQVEPDDIVGLADAATLHFKLQVDRDADCFSVQAVGPGVRFRFNAGALLLDANRIYLGAKRQNPRTNPFSLNR